MWEKSFLGSIGTVVSLFSHSLWVKVAVGQSTRGSTGCAADGHIRRSWVFKEEGEMVYKWQLEQRAHCFPPFDLFSIPPILSPEQKDVGYDRKTGKTV